jgi:hypothetical protein
VIDPEAIAKAVSDARPIEVATTEHFTPSRPVVRVHFWGEVSGQGNEPGEPGHEWEGLVATTYN